MEAKRKQGRSGGVESRVEVTDATTRVLNFAYKQAK